MGTSRGTLYERDTFIVGLSRADNRIGFGECAPLPGLSPDHRSDFIDKLSSVCTQMNSGQAVADLDLAAWPSIHFGVETAMLALESEIPGVLFESGFTQGRRALATNGLVVMADSPDMLRQVENKVAAGFRCIKIKVGALDFEDECSLLAEIRRRYPADAIELRLDANGAFAADAAPDRLDRLSQFTIHSLEQPIKPGQWQTMAQICRESPIAIALDEELIGIDDREGKQALLQAIRPKYIILKPTLLGGFAAAREWIEAAQPLAIGYWVTSALESNIGLNAISQWTATLATEMPQGLGTGRLFEKNFPSALQLQNGSLRFVPLHSSSRYSRFSELTLV